MNLDFHALWNYEYLSNFLVNVRAFIPTQSIKGKGTQHEVKKTTTTNKKTQLHN